MFSHYQCNVINEIHISYVGNILHYLLFNFRVSQEESIYTGVCGTAEENVNTLITCNCVEGLETTCSAPESVQTCEETKTEEPEPEVQEENVARQCFFSFSFSFSFSVFHSHFCSVTFAFLLFLYIFNGLILKM